LKVGDILILSEEMIAKLTEQIGHELENSQIYEYCADYLSVNGLNNLSQYMSNWANEEKTHAQLFRKFLTDLDIHPIRVEINQVNFQIIDVKTIVDKIIEREILTTKKISEELSLSYSDEDGISTEFLLSMQKEQREELNKASNLKNQMYNAKDIYVFDQCFEG